MGWHIGTSGPDAGPYAQCAGLSQMLIFSITANAEHVGSRKDYFKLAYWGIIGVQYWVTGTEHPVRNGITGFTAVENTHIADGSRIRTRLIKKIS